VKNETRRVGVLRSARYPRVAVALGVRHEWYIPLLLCRALSTTSAVWWACSTSLQLYRIWKEQGYLSQSYVEKIKGAVWDDASGVLHQRLLVLQVALSFLWVCCTSTLRMGERTARAEGTHVSFDVRNLLVQLVESTADHSLPPGRHVRLPRTLLHLLPHVSLAPALLALRRHSASVQHVHPPLVRLRLQLPCSRSHRTERTSSKSQLTYLDPHISRAFAIMVLYATGYLCGRR
jgi:hypothetical protein